jgi:hypothetical protein
MLFSKWTIDKGKYSLKARKLKSVDRIEESCRNELLRDFCVDAEFSSR